MLTSRPEWLYKIVDVDNLDHIQSELQYIFQNHYHQIYSNVSNEIGDLLDTNPNLDINKDGTTNQLINIDKELLFKYAPCYIDLLKKLDLYDRWGHTYFAITIPEIKEYVIHKDRDDWLEKCFGFNLPVQNCKDSYTIFYKIKEGITPHTGMPCYIEVPCFFKDDVEYEIGRLPSSQPAFINNNYPHSGFTEHNLFRVLSTTRFHPEIFDYPFENFTSIMPRNENI